MAAGLDFSKVSRSDLIMMDTAIHDRWDMTPQMRSQILAVAIELGTAKNADGTLRAGNRTALAALRVIATFDRLSLEARRIEAMTAPEEVVYEETPMDPAEAKAFLVGLYEDDDKRSTDDGPAAT